MELLRTEKLVKIYNKKRVVDGIDITVKKGEIVDCSDLTGPAKQPLFT